MIYTYSHLEDNVTEIYSKIGISDPHELNVENVSEKLGVTVMNGLVSSRAMQRGKEKIVILDLRLKKEKRWPVFCHEVGHLLQQAGNQLNMPNPFRIYQEWKADSFMYHFSIPTFMLQEMQFPKDINNATVIVAKTFNVSYSFSYKRLTRYFNKIYANELIYKRELIHS